MLFGNFIHVWSIFHYFRVRNGSFLPFLISPLPPISISPPYLPTSLPYLWGFCCWCFLGPLNLNRSICVTVGLTNYWSLMFSRISQQLIRKQFDPVSPSLWVPPASMIDCCQAQSCFRPIAGATAAVKSTCPGRFCHAQKMGFYRTSPLSS